MSGGSTITSSCICSCMEVAAADHNNPCISTLRRGKLYSLVNNNAVIVKKHAHKE